MTDGVEARITPAQPLHLVFGGEIARVEGLAFADPSALDVVGIFPDYASAYDAWKDASQRHIDDALMRYFIVDLGTLMAPELAG